MTDSETTRDLKVMLGDPRRAVLAMSGPLIVSFLVVQINSFADTAWCSLLGVDPSSAASTISPVYWIVSGIGTGIGVGASTSIARCLGRGDKAFFLGVSRWLVLNIPMLFILDGVFGMYGIVWSQTAADILTVILSFCVYKRYERNSLKRC